jgi:glycosyltransferase involved in cell wall biosynthesis
MASGTPVVATPRAVEGLDVIDGAHLLLAEDAPHFAAHVVQLLREPAAADVLARTARRLVEARYDWQTSVAALEAIYETIATGTCSSSGS